MNILLSNKFFYLKGGSERVFFHERDYLLEKGINVIDFSMHDHRNFSSNYSAFFVPSIDYHNSSSIWKRFIQGVKFIHSFETINNIKRLIKHKNIDIAHIHNIYHQLTPSIIPILKKKGVKVVLTIHDGKLLCPGYSMLDKGEICNTCRGKSFWKAISRNCQGSRGREILLTIEAYWHKWKKSYGFVDCLVVPSRFFADLISQRIPESKINVIHNGVDVSEFKQSYQDEGYGLYFGRLSKEKGIETLLKAHALIHDKMPLKIVGTGPMGNELKSNFKRAEFLGYKSGEGLKNIIANSSFVVVPSECYENCSMVVLEAMALGKPIIGSNIGGIPEQIEDDGTGFLFEMGNVKDLVEKMKILVRNPKMRISFGKAAREKLENEYSLERHCVELLRIYNKLISNH